MSNELTLVEQQSRGAVMPIMDIETAVARYNEMKRFVHGVMENKRDYGVIPGTGNKPVLLKPGAEKLTTFFGLSVRFRVVEKTEDWTGAEHGGEPFFYYWFTCQLTKGDYPIAEADGSCNSREANYRYRKAERVCPKCGQGAIIKGREEYGGGWLCYAKKGGCGAKFKDGDAAIEGQETGRVLNPDIADQVNTIQKMGQKRALIAATLLGVNASDFFTQDLEDFVDAPYRVVAEEEPSKPEPARPESRPVSEPERVPPAQAGPDFAALEKAHDGTQKWFNAQLTKAGLGHDEGKMYLGRAVGRTLDHCYESGLMPDAALKAILHQVAIEMEAAESGRERGV